MDLTFFLKIFFRATLPFQARRVEPGVAPSRGWCVGGPVGLGCVVGVRIWLEKGLVEKKREGKSGEKREEREKRFFLELSGFSKPEYIVFSGFQKKFRF